MPEGEEAGRQAEENPCGLANRDTYSCGHIRDTGEENGNPLQHSFLRIPQAEKPSGLESMGLQSVRENLAATEQQYVRDTDFSACVEGRKGLILAVYLLQV